jgi:hypothetical protein
MAGPARDERARRRNRIGPLRPGPGSSVTVRLLVAPSDVPLAVDALAQAGFWVWVGARAEQLQSDEDAVLSAERRLPWRTPTATTVRAQAESAAEALTAASVSYDLVGIAVERVRQPSWRYVKGGYGAEIDEHIPAGTPEQEARDLERVARHHGVPIESLSTVVVPDTNLTATRDLLRYRPAALGLALIGVLCLAAIAWRTARKGPGELVGIALVLGSGLGVYALRRQHGSSFLRPLVGQLLAVVPLFTAFLVGVIYLSYAYFYAPFGVTPLEVGLTTQSMLIQQGFFIALWLGVIVALSLTVYGALWSVPQLQSVERRLDVLQAAMLPLIVAISVLTVLSLTFENGEEFGAAARAGRPYDAFSGGFSWPLPHEVDVLTDDPRQPGFVASARLIYLGQADGMAVLYDRASGSTVRLRDVRQLRLRVSP